MRHLLSEVRGECEVRQVIKAPQAGDMNYNYNSRLVEAIRQGYLVAFWNVLRRVAEHAGTPGW